MFIHLGKRQLNTGFNGVEKHRIFSGSDNIFCYTKLIFKHKFRKLCQDAIFRVKNGVKTAAGYACIMKNFRHRRLMISLFYKQADTG